MIRLDKIGKQNGKQILFIEASAALQRGEKVGLVGPNGAGKTTLFRMITGEELPDEGQVSTDRGVTIGYFSQDVGEMSGRSVVAEVMDGAGPVSAVAAELKALEAGLADPDRADEMETLIERYGEVQARFEDLDGYALEGRAQEVLAGLSFSQEMMDGDVGALSGGWKMRVALARILLMDPDVMLLDEPSNHLDLESLIWLEAFLKGYEGALLMTSHDREFMNRIVGKVVEIDGGALTTYSGDYVFYEQQRALNETHQQAQFERQQAMLAKEIKFIERFKARASHAAQVQSRVKKLDKIERVEPPRRRQSVTFEFQPAPRSGDDVVSLKNVHKSYGGRSIYAGLDFSVQRRERWCVMGINGAGKSTLLKLVTNATQPEPDAGKVALGGSVKLGYFAQHAMDLLDADATIFEDLEASFPAGRTGSAAGAVRLFRVFRRRRRKAMPRALGRREGAPRHGQNAVRPPELSGPRRAHEPSRHRHEGDADQGVVAVRGHDALRLARPAFSRGPVQPRTRTDARRGPHLRRRLHRIRRPHRPRGPRPAKLIDALVTMTRLISSGQSRRATAALGPKMHLGVG